MKNVVNVKASKEHQFKKGNPGGPGRGYSKKVDVVLRNDIEKIVKKETLGLSEQQMKKLIDFAYERALSGSSSYAKLVFDKFIAESRKRVGEPLKATKLKTVTNVADAMEEVTNMVRLNMIDLDTALTLMNMYKMTGDFVRDTAVDVVKNAAEELTKNIKE